MRARRPFVFLCGSVLLAQTSLDLTKEAEQLLRTGRTQDARAALEKASGINHQTAESEDRIGFLLAVMGDQTSAHEHFRKAIALDANYAAAHFHLGASDWLQGVKQEGIRELETAVRLAPNVFDYRFRLGGAYLDMGDAERAAVQLQMATHLDSSNQPAWRSLGQALDRKGDLVPAIDAYRHALQLNENDVNVRNELAALYVKTRQPELAIREANRILQSDPKNFAAQMNLGYAYLKTGDYAKAEAAYRAAITDDANSAAPHYDLGIALKMQDKLDDARAEFQTALTLDRSMAEAQYSIGIIAWQSGDFETMRKAMKEAVAIRPDYAEAHYMLGIALKGMDRPDEAIDELHEAMRLDPTTPGPYNTLAQILRAKGDQKGAAEAFATGARLKKEKDAQLANNLDQGMRGGEMLTPKQ
jgi:tetratricopeptide (TPR) repeat protein